MSTSASAQPRHVFVRNGQIFTSLTSNYLPDIPVQPLSYEYDPPYSQCLQPRWLDPRFHSIAFTPLAPRLENRFSVLKGSRNEFVEEVSDRNGTRWQTPPALCRAFVQLEEDLLLIAKILTNSIVFYGLDFKTPPTPSKYGYGRSHAEARIARRAINQSREGFLVVMAYISYLITMFDDNLITALPHESDFLRWEYILQQSGISQEIIQDLKRSEICEFGPSYPRVGVFIKYDNWTFHRTLQKCVKYGVPVWVHWPSADQWSPEPAIMDHLPTREEIQFAIREEKEKKEKPEGLAEQQNLWSGPIPWGTSWGNSWADISSLRPSGSLEVPTPVSSGQQTASNMRTPGNTVEASSSSGCSSDQKIPTPVPGSRQTLGETPHQFIKRMTEARLRRMQTESDRSRQQRESRERSQMKHPIPGHSSKAPVVWHWEVDVTTGVRRRVRVFREAVEQYWENYSNKERYYDAYHNEWDLCTEFDPDTEQPRGYDTDDDDDDDFYMASEMYVSPASPAPDHPLIYPHPQLTARHFSGQ
jgi:hypothetical protein